jgi:PAS domain S-box-containing protein
VIQCNIRDITARKRASNDIAAEKERLAVTLRSIGDGVITTDTQGNIEIMNKIAEELCGWSQNEAQGKSLVSVFNIINENTRKPHENPVEKVLATGEITELANHTVIISKDGTERIISDSAAPIRNRNNTIIGVVLVFRDITEKQKLLETSQRNLKLESLGILAGGIAHDFNNLMGGIFGCIDIAITESKDSNVTQYLSKALNTMERARGLTQQLLTFAKGGAPVQKITLLFPLIQETAQFALSGSNVSCRYDIAKDLWPCIIDKNQICQVIDNIIINAQQAMPGGGTVEMSARNISIGDKEHQLLQKGNYVRISIKDQGIGISKKMLARIFDPFFTTKPKGHGLGLATCYSIINRHNGAIDVESVLDEGSTFHIYLLASPESVILDAATGVKHKGSGRILIMDDEEIFRMYAAKFLTTLGYSVVCTEDGKETLDLFIEETKAGRPFAAIILDLIIPGGTGGKEIIVEIRKLNTEIPVFVVSGYAEDPVMAGPADYGFTDSLSKPFSMEELSEMLNKNLKK